MSEGFVSVSKQDFFLAKCVQGGANSDQSAAVITG